MRIAIYHNLPSGGAKRLLFEFTKRLADHHQIYVFTTSVANHDFGDLRPFAIEHHVYPFKFGKLFKSPFGRLNQLVRFFDLRRIQTLDHKIAKDILKENFDVVFINPCQIQNAPSIIRHLHGLPLLFFCQEPLRILYEDMPFRPYNKKENPFRKFIDGIDPLKALYFQSLKNNDRKNVQSAKYVLVNSAFSKQGIDSIYDVQSIVCYPGVDTKLFRYQPDLKENFIFSVGSLTPLKGFNFIIEALGLIPPEIRPKLKIANNFTNPPEKEYILNLANNLDVIVELESAIDDETLVSLYNQAMFTVYTPYREPFGLVAIESMACGTPIISINEGGPLETILQGETGFLVQRDPPVIAEAIKTLLTQPETRKNFSKRSRDHVLKNWTWEISVQKLEKIISNA